MSWSEEIEKGLTEVARQMGIANLLKASENPRLTSVQRKDAAILAARELGLGGA